MSTLEKNPCPLNTVDPSKSSQSLGSKFILSSLDFAFNMWKSNCVPGQGQRRCYSCGSRIKLGVPALSGSLQQTSLNVATMSPELTQLAVADSKEKKVQSLFRGSCNVELCFGQRRVCLVEWWQLLLSPSHSNTLDVSRPQTNNDSVWVGLSVRVKCSLTLSTCLSNELALQQNVRQGRKFQAQRDLQCLCQIRGTVVNRVCTRQNT